MIKKEIKEKIRKRIWLKEILKDKNNKLSFLLFKPQSNIKGTDVKIEVWDVKDKDNSTREAWGGVAVVSAKKKKGKKWRSYAEIGVPSLEKVNKNPSWLADIFGDYGGYKIKKTKKHLKF